MCLVCRPNRNGSVVAFISAAQALRWLWGAAASAGRAPLKVLELTYSAAGRLAAFIISRQPDSLAASWPIMVDRQSETLVMLSPATLEKTV